MGLGGCFVLVHNENMSTGNVYSDNPGSWPSPAEEELGDVFTFDEWLGADQADSFIAKVPGDLVAIGILRGDMVIVRRGQRVREGDLIAVYGDGGLMVGRCGALVVDEDARMLGVVTAVVRKC